MSIADEKTVLVILFNVGVVFVNAGSTILYYTLLGQFRLRLSII